MASLDSYLSIISYPISLVFLLLFPYRLHRLTQQTIKVKTGGWRGRTKLGFAALLVLVQVITIFVPYHDRQNSGLYLSVVPTIATSVFVFLSSLEHRRSVRPSTLILLYLLSSLSLDLVQLTAPSLRYLLQNGQHLYLIPQLAAKALVLCTELLLDKRSELLEEWQNLPPEETCSIFGRSLMWWMNTILAKGYKSTLINEELPDIDHGLSSRVLREKILDIWCSDTASSPWLLTALIKCLLQPGLLLVIWRVLLILFRYSQPVLITYSIAFLNSPSSSQDQGYFIVLAAIFVHMGYAFVVRAYQLGLNRLQIMVRGSLVGLIHQNSLLSANASHKDSGGSSTPVALITTDVAALEGAVETFYMTWACVIEVIIGTVMLARQVGWVWPLPHLITISCSRINAYVARNLKTRQAEWNAATRKRIALTSSVLSSAKTVKMLGMQDAVEQQILELRHDELDKAARVRWIRVVYNASANALGMFAPVITIVVFAVVASFKGEPLNPETAFPTIAILALVTHSANMVMTIIPKAVAAYPSFERIQAYLQNGPAVLSPDLDHDDTYRDQRTSAILVKSLDVSWSNGQTALSSINIDIPKGSIVACSGPVGSGKTTLARAILGEKFPSLSGIVETCSIGGRIAYCAQTAWLPNRTIREVIHGPGTETKSLGYVDDGQDTAWYQTVVQACCLDEDLGLLPDGDSTVVGDGGMNLSGGQRQRVALARAVFQRCEIAVLDDVFSALDGRTEKQVAENLFGTGTDGARGLFRKLGTTVFWITSSTRHYHMADYVVVLETGGRIEEQGPWSKLKASGQHISRLIHSHDADHKSNSAAKQEDADEYERGQQKQQVTISKSPDDMKTTRGDGDLSLYGYYFSSAGHKSIMFLLFCTASTAFFMTFPQYWMKWWTEDAATRNQDSNHTTTAFYATGYALLALAAWISTNGIMWSQLLWVAPAASIMLHRRLLETILGAPLAYFSTTDTGTILNHFSQDISLVDGYIATSLSAVSTQVFKLIFQASVIFAVQPLMSLTLPICVVVVYIVQKIYLRTSRQMRIIELESRSAVFSSLLETADGAETIRSFKWHVPITRENITALDLSQKPFYLLFCLQRWLGVVLNLLGAGVTVAVITLAVMLKGTTTGAQIGVALNVLLVTKTTLLRLVDVYTDLEISLGAVSRLRSVEEGTPREEDENEHEQYMGWDDGIVGFEEQDGDRISCPGKGGLEFRSVSASYNENSLALRDIDLSIAPGETVAICGRTGSGKSSILLALLRLIKINSGTITVNGIDINRLPLATVRQILFVTIAQDPYFLHETCLRFNLDPSGLLSTQELVQILHQVGLWSHLVLACGPTSTTQDLKTNQGSTTTNRTESTENNNGNFPGEHTPLLTTKTINSPLYNDDEATKILNKPFSSIPTLSGGQAQLLALARGIAQCQAAQTTQFHQTGGGGNMKKIKPIILLDEVTASLDNITEQRVCEIVQEVFVEKGYTVVIVTHRLGEVLAAAARRRQAQTQAQAQAQAQAQVQAQAQGLERDSDTVARTESRIEQGHGSQKGLTVVWMRDGRVEKVETEGK
ncbi:P-loop containing nucleoside triphosphate hydrolase protein [Rhypophila decipiens]|uniref:P-loop containing nucleoside triphosphate hydrolase protein n=1 Tax=Rhypophila decipiens TaxID=261697 RepID=A0AAN6YDV2_9PEZI|nr:P-loop containing nucleoside triphosphate hydrolase protein [Rhypophila decipiens]